MTTQHLRFPDETTAKSILAEYWLDTEHYVGWQLASHYHALDPVGVIYQPTGVILTDDNGIEYPEMAPIEGWHVNFIGELPSAALPYLVTPESPVRVFAE